MTEKFGKAMMVALFCSVLGLYGYGQSNAPQGGRRNTQTPSAGADRNQNTPNSVNAGPVAKLVESNTAEVELGKMAADKAENPRVKEFADMMVRDHTDALMKTQLSASGNPTGTKLNARPETDHGD